MTFELNPGGQEGGARIFWGEGTAGAERMDGHPVGGEGSDHGDEAGRPAHRPKPRAGPGVGGSETALTWRRH